MSDYAISETSAKSRSTEQLSRRTWDTLISGAGAVVGTVLLVLGALALIGGIFAHSNVRDRLSPENITFPPAAAMTTQEVAEVGQFAGQKVDTGAEAEGFSRYIGGHLAEVNGGKTYSETSAAARAEGISPKVAADLQVKADTLFKGETLRSILLNAYGWWKLGTITLFAAFAMLIAGGALLVLAALGFGHARKSA